MNELPAVTVFGLGIIGSRCADNLENAGYPTSRWNRSPDKHPSQCSSLEEAAKSPLLSFYLKDGVACRQVFQGVRDFLTPSHTLLNHSTIDLETTQWLAQQCCEMGIAFLDSPFTGSKDASALGNLVYYVGGDQSLIDQHKKMLEVTSKEIHHLGKIGDATIVKLATNLISASTIQAVSEAMAITSAYGISPELLTQAVSSNACGSFLTKLKMPSMSSDEFEPHFSLANMLKDSKFAIALAEQKGIPTPGIKTTSQQMETLSQQGHQDSDFSVLIKQFTTS